MIISIRSIGFSVGLVTSLVTGIVSSIGVMLTFVVPEKKNDFRSYSNTKVSALVKLTLLKLNFEFEPSKNYVPKNDIFT